MTWQAKWVESQEGFNTAKRVLEIGAGAFKTTIALAAAHPDKEIVGLDFSLSAPALRNLAECPPNLTVLRHDARTLDIFATDYFDMAFSVAVMEHIHELAQHLQEMHRVLRPDARYCFWEAPFWSSSMGHHYRHSSPDCPIPHYGHLYLPRSDLARHLSSLGKNPVEVGAILSYIFERPDLSRLSRAQTKQIIESSAFEIRHWIDDQDQHFTAERAEKVLRNNIFGIEASDLPIKGAKVTLAKPMLQ